MKDQLSNRFKEVFSQNATNIFFAPGRVNLIGEHIDYNGGLVMPCAITFGTYLLTAPNKEGKFRFRGLNFDEQLDIPLQQAYQKDGKSWYNYPLGVIHHLLAEGNALEGLDLLFYGDLPISAGLSSSASIEVVTAYAFNELFNLSLSRLDLVKLTKRVENEFIGVNSGIMDQFAITFGKEHKALKLDCESLNYEAVDCNLQDHLLAIINTNKPRNLAESKYNERVSECQQALKWLQKELDITNLCDLNTSSFNRHTNLIKDEVILKRAQHVVQENERVHHAAKALEENRLREFGILMYSSHNSLKDLYEVSGKELDTIIDFCETHSSVTGARMTGAGFGGCAIALVKKDAFEDFSQKITAFYKQKIGYEPSVYSSLIGDGVKELV